MVFYNPLASSVFGGQHPLGRSYTYPALDPYQDFAYATIPMQLRNKQVHIPVVSAEAPEEGSNLFVRFGLLFNRTVKSGE